MNGESRSSIPRVCLVLCVLGVSAMFALAPGLFLHRSPWGCISAFGPTPLLTSPLDRIVLALLAVGLAPIPFLPRPAIWIRVWCAAMVVRCAPDLLTWQPYLLMYVGFLFALSAIPWRSSNREATERALDAVRLGMIGIYCCSGFAKLHLPFFTTAGPIMLDPLTTRIGIGSPIWVCAAAAMIEFAAGICLLFARTRRPAAVMLIAMHVYLLLVLGPLGSSYNAVVWPWNIVMLGLLIALFLPGAARPVARLAIPSHGVVRYLTIFLFVVAPALSYAGVWPSYLSFRLYALRYPRGYVLVHEAVIPRLPPAIQEHVERQDNLKPFHGLIRIHQWGEASVGALPPFNVRLYEQMTRRFAEWAPDIRHVGLFVRPPPRWPWEATGKDSLRTLATIGR